MKSKIDFDAIEMRRGHILIEIPTGKTAAGIILVNETKTLTMGWYKVVKSGKKDNSHLAMANIEEDIITDLDKGKGKAAFIFFNNNPIELPEVVFKTKEEQEDEAKKQEAMSDIVIADNLGGIKRPDMFEDGRIFALIPEREILFIRDL